MYVDWYIAVSRNSYSIETLVRMCINLKGAQYTVSNARCHTGIFHCKERGNLIDDNIEFPSSIILVIMVLI